MNGEKPVETSLREVGVEVRSPHPKPLTVRHKIQRVWSLLFGKNQDDLIPVHCNLAGALSVVPVPLTDMVVVESGVLEVDVTKTLAGFADLILVKCWGHAPNSPQLFGQVDDGGWVYWGDATAYGGIEVSAENYYFPCQMRLEAHVNKIKVTSTFAGGTIIYHTYRYKLR